MFQQTGSPVIWRIIASVRSNSDRSAQIRSRSPAGSTIATYRSAIRMSALLRAISALLIVVAKKGHCWYMRRSNSIRARRSRVPAPCPVRTSRAAPSAPVSRKRPMGSLAGPRSASTQFAGRAVSRASTLRSRESAWPAGRSRQSRDRRRPDPDRPPATSRPFAASRPGKVRDLIRQVCNPPKLATSTAPATSSNSRIAISGMEYRAEITSPCSVSLIRPWIVPGGWARIASLVGPPPRPIEPPRPWKKAPWIPCVSNSSVKSRLRLEQRPG